MITDLNHLIKQTRPPNYRSQVRDFQDFKPQEYSKFSHPKSFVTTNQLDKKRFESMYVVEQKKVVPTKKIIPKNKTEKERRHLLMEIGGFKNKMLLNKFDSEKRKREA